MPKTLYERDMEDSLRQIAVALGVDVSGTPDVEDVIRAAGKAGKDAERYRHMRKHCTSVSMRGCEWIRDQPDADKAFDDMADASMAIGAA